MKKSILTITLLLVTIVSFGQLNVSALALKDSETVNVYEPMRARGINDWGNDHKMVVYEINKQADSWFELMNLVTNSSEEDKKFAYELLVQVTEEWVEQIDGERNIDWKMALYEYKSQIKNINY